MKIYLLPGYGFDNRIFERLELAGKDREYINWMEPRKQENIRSYAERMAQSIDRNHDENVLIGHSLGGMLCQEIAAIKRISKIILISSIQSRKELPFRFKIIEPLRLHHLFSGKMVADTVKYWGKNHDYKSEEEQELFRKMVSKQSNTYLQWALRQLSIWEAPEVPERTSIFHIHGALDKTFPINRIRKVDQVIEQAGHFMVFSEAERLNGIITNEIFV